MDWPYKVVWCSISCYVCDYLIYSAVDRVIESGDLFLQLCDYRTVVHNVVKTRRAEEHHHHPASKTSNNTLCETLNIT